MLNIVVSAVLIAVLHSLAPDHYLPYTVLGRARNWTVRNILLLSLLAGTFHVSSSVGIGYALILGIDLLGFAETLEAFSSPLLIFIGLGYAVVSLLKPHRHVHSGSLIALLAVSLAPCLPLIPLMLASPADAGITATTFGLATLATILLMTYTTSRTLKPPEFLHGREDFFAGIVIAGSGIFSMIAGVRHEGN